MTEFDADLPATFTLDGADLMPALEAILMVASEPVSIGALVAATGMAPEQVEAALRRLQADYNGDVDVDVDGDVDGDVVVNVDADGVGDGGGAGGGIGQSCGGGRRRGFELRQVQDKWRLFSRAEWAPWVGAFVAGSESSTLSRAAMETLAIIAYRQPVTRMQIARIRGVNVDSVLRTLLARDLIEESGESPTGAHLFHTTQTFLEKMGLTSIDDLVPLAPFVPGPERVDELVLELEE